MLALAAIIVGSILTGYSAYKIHAARRGESRKLRDMEVLRRLNVPPKKQVRVWSALMVLGLVLLTPGLGLLLSSDRGSGYVGNLSPSGLRPSTPGSPLLVPPSEKLDMTPKTVDEGRSGAFGGGAAFASSGGSGKRASSGGGGGSSSAEAKEGVRDDLGGSSKGEGPDHHPPEANETPTIYKAGSARDRPRIGEVSPSNTTAGPEGGGLTDGSESGALPEAPAAGPEPAGEEAVAIGPSVETTSEGVAEKRPLPDLSRPVVAGSGTPSARTGERAEPEALDEAPEEGGGSDDPGHLAAGPAPKSATSSEVAGSAAIDVAREKRTAPSTSRRLPSEEKGAEEVGDPEKEGTAPPAPAEASGMEGEAGHLVAGPEPTSPPPSPELDISDGSLEPPGLADLGMELAPEDPAPVMGAQVEEVKKLLFREATRSDMTVGEAPSGADLIGVDGDGVPPGNMTVVATPSEADELNGSSDIGSNLSVGRIAIDAEFKNFGSANRLGMGIDENGTQRPVMIMEFEKIDLESNFRQGLGLTPTSGFR